MDCAHSCSLDVHEPSHVLQQAVLHSPNTCLGMACFWICGFLPGRISQVWTSSLETLHEKTESISETSSQKQRHSSTQNNIKYRPLTFFLSSVIHIARLVQHSAVLFRKSQISEIIHMDISSMCLTELWNYGKPTKIPCVCQVVTQSIKYPAEANGTKLCDTVTSSLMAYAPSIYMGRLLYFRWCWGF